MPLSPIELMSPTSTRVIPSLIPEAVLAIKEPHEDSPSVSSGGKNLQITLRHARCPILVLYRFNSLLGLVLHPTPTPSDLVARCVYSFAGSNGLPGSRAPIRHPTQAAVEFKKRSALSVATGNVSPRRAIRQVSPSHPKAPYPGPRGDEILHAGVRSG